MIRKLVLIALIAWCGMLMLRSPRSTLQVATEDAAAGTKDEVYDGPLIGSSARMRAVQKLVGISAASDATVLVTGETGTGKEIVARSIHLYGARSGRPMIAINCAAVPPTLLESELFGHVRGAFTGATHDRAGYFREASGSTLFLDEIGDMDLAMQRKLLRVLQEGEFRKVGGREPIKVDVRILSATNVDLAARLQEGKFREDLYFRLKVMSIRVPPLRERRGDIPLLVKHFLAGTTKESGRAPPTISEDAHAILMNYSWPGNVRELKNVLERALILGRGREVGLHALPDRIAAQATKVPVLGGDFTLDEIEREHILRVVARAPTQDEAARILGIDASTLWRKRKRGEGGS